MNKILLLLIASSSCASLIGYVDDGESLAQPYTAQPSAPLATETDKLAQEHALIAMKAACRYRIENDEEHQQLKAGRPTTQQSAPASTHSCISFFRGCIKKITN